MAKVSVIVPIYNLESYLRKCVDSLLAQTLTDIEIILVDDGSMDSGGAICDEYEKTNSRVRVIHKQNGGLSDARNAGIDLAQGDYLGFVDADDYVLPEMYEALYRACTESGARLAACDRAYHLDRETAERSPEEQQFRLATSEEFFGALLRYDSDVGMGMWNKLYERSLFDEVRFPTGKLHEDTATLYRLVFQTDFIACIPFPYYIHVKHPGSITTIPYGTRDYDRFEANRTMFQYIADHHPNLLQAAAENRCVSNLNIARNMIASGAYDSEMYQKIRQENRTLLSLALKEGSITKQIRRELRLMCVGYRPYRLFLRLRRIRRK